MKLIWKSAGAVVLLAVAAGCVYGFMSTFGPTHRTELVMSFRFACAIVAVMCVGGASILIAECFRK